ncbi:hypothetical protein [Cellulomonas sp. RIT-PI-Y]|uniref:hypothetical protein n=1 Tax=Cellulomonas sp. RIT-PI-Y TaxID=3035297 RepID=UPI0021D9B993|nr:hypothetical protein [Cellulomonas sp. RIT-PI-Y]
MVNKSKNLGTRAETAVVRAARTRGFSLADRLTLTGALDRGDVGLCPGVIVEVKGGNTARTASDVLIDSWLRETERERDNAGARWAFLVVQRGGVGPANAHRWWAWWRFGWLFGGATDSTTYRTPIRMQFGDALHLLRDAGYGEPNEANTGNERPNVSGDVRVQGATR